MEEERFAREVKKGKRFNNICFSVLICFILVVAVAVISYMNRPLSDSITVEGAENALSGSGILVKTDSSYYEIDGSSEFINLFELNKWNSCQQFSDTDQVLATLHLGEQYEMYLHGDGRVSFFDGYADAKTKATAYYEVPADVVGKVIGYITEHGSKRTLGDGKIAMSTFLK